MNVGVMDTETTLAEEVVGVCRDYCVETWAEALNRAGVLAISELRSTENIFFSEDIRENLAMLPPPTILPSPPSEWPSTIQVPSSGAEVLTGAIKNKKDDMGGPQLEDKGKDKGVQPPTEANYSEDALTIKDVVFKAKDAESKSKTRDTKSKTADHKEDSLRAKPQS